MSNTKLLELYKRDPFGTRTLLVENIQDHDHEHLRNYLKDICKEKVTDVYFPEEESNYAIVSFGEDLKDLEKSRDEASKTGFKDSRLSLQLLGQPLGIFIGNASADFTEEYLSLYFENKRSGGKEGCVEDVKFFPSGTGKHAIINISCPTDATTLLIEGVPNHLQTINPPENTLPSTDDEILSHVASDDSNINTKQSDIKSSFEQTQVDEPQTQLIGTTCGHLQIICDDQEDECAFVSTSKGCDTKVTDMEKIDTVLRCSNPNTPARVDRLEPRPMGNEDEINTKRPINNRSNKDTNNVELTGNTFGPLHIISEDKEDETYDTESYGATKGRLPGPFQNETKICSSSRDIPTSVSHELLHTDSGNKIASITKQGDTVTLKDESVTKALCKEVEMSISPVEIRLLTLLRVQEKLKTYSCTMNLKEEDGKIIINGHTDEDITGAKLSLYEYIEDIVCEVETLPAIKCEFLSREDCRNYIKSRCNKENVNVTYEIDMSKTELQSYAFSADVAKWGLQFIKEDTALSVIFLKHWQVKLLENKEWKTMLEVLNIGLTTVYQDESTNTKLIVESFDKSRVEEARMKIDEYLEEQMSEKESPTITLHAAKADCFLKYIEIEFRRHVEKTNGKLHVDRRSTNPSKIDICIEGDETLTDDLKKKIDEIWHEYIDFSKISDKDEDKQLMLMGISSKTGKVFLETFESVQNCIIHVKKEGQFTLRKTRSEESMLLPAFEDTSGCGSQDEEDCSPGDMETSSYALHGERDIQQKQPGKMREQKATRRFHSAPFQTQREGIRMKNAEVNLVQGQIVEQVADALVNIVSPSFSMEESVVSKAFVQKGGETIIMSIRRVIAKVLQDCKDCGYKSVAFPPLGVGKMYKYPPDWAANCMLKEICQLLQMSDDETIEQITIVIYDKETYSTFETAFRKFDQRAINESNELKRKAQHGHSHSRSHKSETHHGRHGHTSSGRRTDGQSKGAHHRRSMFEQGTDPVSNLKVTVYAESKRICLQARNELGKQIKEEFLHVKIISKGQKISEDTESKIKQIIECNGITSSEEDDKYILKGQKENVTKASYDIFQLLLQQDTVRKQQRSNVKRGTLEFIQLMAEEEPEIPSYWTSYTPSVPLKSVQITREYDSTKKAYEETDVDKPTADAIVKMVEGTFDKTLIGKGRDAKRLDPNSYSTLHVHKIKRIENLGLYSQFSKRRQDLYTKLLTSKEVSFPEIVEVTSNAKAVKTSAFVDSSLDKDLNPELNEVLLFHGTKEENVDVICSSGLDERLGSTKGMFGSGIYGAESSLKADQYADDKDTRTFGKDNPKKMFLMRMALGNSYVCTDDNPKKYRRPPCTSCGKDDCRDTHHAQHKFGHLHDSVVGDNGKLFREFVVYDRSSCYPEYLITYERL